MKFHSKQNKNKSATRGAQLVHIGIPTICLCNLVPNLTKLLSKRYIKASQTFWQNQRFNRFGSSEVKEAILSLQAR